MTGLVVRKLLIDLQEPLPARWCGGDAFKSAWFNALSMSFPLGEQYFMDSVRAGLKTLAPEVQARMAPEIQAFIGQEATHRRIHSLFNAHLARQGLVNTLEPRAQRRMQANAFRDVKIHVAATAATEHITALFAEWMFRHPEALQGSQDRLQTLWMWHSAEEAEHRSTAFDLYQAMGGSHAWRVRLLSVITTLFFTDVLRQTMRNLWHDGSLFHWSTWRSAASFLFAKDGMLRGNVRAWRAYRAPDFHPTQQASSAAVQWLQSNQALYTPVTQPT